MSNFRYIKVCTLACLAFLAFGCADNDPDDLFSKSANERKNERIAELQNELLSSEYGWKFTYFTDDFDVNDPRLGGFSHVFRCLDDHTIEMISDFDQNSLIVGNPSSYRISMAGTVSLLFDTKNKIHLLSDSGNSPSGLEAKGYKGDFEFQYYGIEENGLKFRTTRSAVDLVFERATAEDWEDLKLNRNVMTVLNSKKRIFVVEGDNAESYNFSFNTQRRFALILDATETMSVNANGGVGIGFQKDGIIINPPIEFEDGSSLSELKLVGNQFIGQVGNNQIIIQ